MFKRLFYDEWTAMIPIIAFLITFIGFLILTIRAILMRREVADEISRLPLDDTSTTQSKIDHV
jgi:hypothetical protein